MDPWTIIGAVAAVVAVPVAVAIYILSIRKAQVHYESGGGILTRCLTQPQFAHGWGIISVTGELRVSHRTVTVVDARLSYKMDAAHVRPSKKFIDDTFPPLFVFPRVANDEAGTIPAFPRRDFSQVKLSPGEGQQSVRIQFALGGNFAEEYSNDFFSRKLCSNDRLFVSMMIRFEYEDNGHFYWTKDFTIPVCPMTNQGWTPDGPSWIDDNGHLLQVRYGSPVSMND